MIPVFYRPEQSCASNESFSPSAGKPRQVVADWQGKSDIAPYIQIESFDPLTPDDIKLAHDRAYVDAVLACREENGFGNKSAEVAASLLYTTGSLFAAAKRALTSKIAVSPTSGFHHANHSFGGGFCTFNGLVITALKLKKLGLVKAVLILDFDGHYGDGTDSCIKAAGAQKWLFNVTRSKHYDDARSCLRMTRPARLYEYVVNDMKVRPDLVLYQAGADLWQGDPLGAGLLSREQMRERDAGIFSAAHKNGVPIVMNLAGGYAKDANGTIAPVLKLHRQTVEEAIKLFAA